MFSKIGKLEIGKLLLKIKSRPISESPENVFHDPVDISGSSPFQQALDIKEKKSFHYSLAQTNLGRGKNFSCEK